MNLVIIEGVGKQDTIKKYLGEDFEVVATKGHFRDLPEKKLGVSPVNGFEPEYEIMPDKQSVVKMLKDKAKKADQIYLATDPDREGEAISWHLAHVLDLDSTDKNRIVFNEITKSAIQNALKEPRAIDQKLVDAQQARRVLDRLVGYKLSPIISKKIQPKLSAGRVQSVALKILVDREKEIQSFVPEEYWTLIADVYKNTVSDTFKTTLNKFNNKKAVISSREEMDKVLSALNSGQYVVKTVKKSIGKTKPSAPYTTSTMQQDALNKLGFSLKRASSCAQELYEGVNIKGEGKVALVTYIRTDSVRVAPDAINMAKDYIKKNFGDNYYPKTPNFYKSKGGAQDAHEAIRPISLDLTPESIKGDLSPDNYKLYKLIYDRFLASQMAEGTYHLVVVEIENSNYIFKSTGKTPIFDGYQIVYTNPTKKKTAKKSDDEEAEDDEEGLNDNLPELNEGDVLTLVKLTDTQKFTKPPARYTEASLVNEMEQKGIGRPATYTPTITTLTNRTYVGKEGRHLVPSELGFKVTELLDLYFADIINVKFTAQMEDKLDQISEESVDWKQMVKEFYSEFEVKLKEADADSVTFKVPPKETDEVCEKCGSMMYLRTGRYGEFLACSNFPNCKNIRSLVKQVAVAKCPKCEKGDVFLKTSRKGAKFFACGNYPDCDYISWTLPNSDIKASEYKPENK